LTATCGLSALQLSCHPLGGISMNIKNIFKCILIAFLCLEIVGLLLPSDFSKYPIISKDDMNRLSLEGQEQYVQMAVSLVTLGVLSFLGIIVSLIGLWVFWRPSRELFIFSSAFAIVFLFSNILQKELLQRNWHSYYTISYLISVLIIIFLSYSDSMKKYFYK
jgi:hypothetical protein